jgi:hypothetical protein
MSLLDEASDETHYLRKLVVGYSGKEIDLTSDDACVITHNPESCPSCAEWYKTVREIGEANPYLFDKEGYVCAMRIAMYYIEKIFANLRLLRSELFPAAHLLDALPPLHYFSNGSVPLKA